MRGELVHSLRVGHLGRLTDHEEDVGSIQWYVSADCWPACNSYQPSDTSHYFDFCLSYGPDFASASPGVTSVEPNLTSR